MGTKTGLKGINFLAVFEIVAYTYDSVKHFSTRPERKHGSQRFISAYAQAFFTIFYNIDDPDRVVAAIGHIYETGQLYTLYLACNVYETGQLRTFDIFCFVHKTSQLQVCIFFRKVNKACKLRAFDLAGYITKACKLCPLNLFCDISKTSKLCPFDIA
ncbi:hypothetical protein D3C87_1358740 [compost metagenome]